MARCKRACWGLAAPALALLLAAAVAPCEAASRGGLQGCLDAIGNGTQAVMRGSSLYADASM